ncbi:HlyD family secretion protein [Anaerotignum sp.]|uniref:HlyD family secretion protein n=1 Tax=Anaerotignum sp. TaxID=2039241 RepID=UPI002714CDE0|nr:efflux RND transporter periplasmic adaptor subunit [Anaerotignum sp.]
MNYKKYVALFLAFLFIFFTGCSGQDQESEQINAEADDTDVNNDIVVWGEVKYNNEYQINIDFPSTVEDILVEEGDYISSGSTLITLSMLDYENNTKKLQIQADSSKEALGNVDQAALKMEIATLKKQISTKTEELNNGSNADLQLLENSLIRAEKELSDSQNDLIKYQKLFEIGAISQADLDEYSDVLNQKEKAKSDIEENIAKIRTSLQEELDALNTALKYKEVQLKQQKNIAAKAKLDFDLMRSKCQKPYLSGNSIISNLDNGIVKKISVVKGSVLGTQNVAQEVIDLIDADSIFVSAEVPEEFIEQISQNSKAFIVPTANKNLKIEGQIIRIANQAIEKDGDRIVKVQVKPDDKDNILKPGFTADVQFSRIESEPSQ